MKSRILDSSLLLNIDIKRILFCMLFIISLSSVIEHCFYYHSNNIVTELNSTQNNTHSTFEDNNQAHEFMLDNTKIQSLNIVSKTPQTERSFYFIPIHHSHIIWQPPEQIIANIS